MINHQKVPKTGWRYRQEKTNTTVVATDWNTLVNAVREHRRVNGIPPGDIEEDVDEQIEKNNPELSI